MVKLGSRLPVIGMTALLAILLAACLTMASQAQAAGGSPGLCRKKAAEALAGRNRISDAQAKRMTGATLVRQIKPGEPVTMDYRRKRITIETDPKTGKIVRAYCG